MVKHRPLSVRRLTVSVPWELLLRYIEGLKPEDKPDSWKPETAEMLEEFLSDPANAEASAVIREGLQRINDLCGSHVNLLYQAYEWAGITCDYDRSPEELAMRLLLDHPPAYDYAWGHHLLYGSAARTSQYRLAAGELKVTPTREAGFQGFMQSHFLGTKKGPNCLVHCFNESKETLVLVARGSYMRTVSKWRGGEVVFETFRPAVEDVLLFEPSKSRLSVKVGYNKDRPWYVRAFASCLAGNGDLGEQALREPVFSLRPFQNGTFDIGGNRYISRISVIEITGKLPGAGGIPFSFGPTEDALRTYRQNMRTPLTAVELTKVRLRLRLRVESDRRPLAVTCTIATPRSTDLFQKRYSDIIDAYLQEQGVKLV